MCAVMNAITNTFPAAELQRDGATAKAAPVPDDMAMLRAAAELTRDINTANKTIYWTDFLGSALLGYAALFAAIMANSTGTMLAAAVVSVAALYRAGSFIHELTHTTVFIKSNADFNERLASFVGNKGTEMYYKKQEGADSATVKQIILENEDDRQFSEFITIELNDLKKWYQEHPRIKSYMRNRKE